MRLAAVVIVLAGTGCDVIFTLTEPPGDASVDPDAVTSSCTSSLVFTEDFESSGEPCGAGAADPDPPGNTLDRALGRLVLRPRRFGVEDADISCTWTGISLADGAFLEVLQPLEERGTYTQIGFIDNEQIVGIKVIRNASSMFLKMFEADAGGGNEEDLGDPLSFSATTMRWWRLRLVGQDIVGEISSDADSWVGIGSIPNPFAGSAERFLIGAGQFEDFAVDPGAAIVDNLNVCP